jgi:hypothetical protein
VALALPDDSIDRRQAQSGSLPLTFRREEGLEATLANWSLSG